MFSWRKYSSRSILNSFFVLVFVFFFNLVVENPLTEKGGTA